MAKLKESTKKDKKIRASQNSAKDVETKTRLVNLKVQLADAVMKQSKMTEELNKVSTLCNRLATEIEKLNGENKT